MSAIDHHDDHADEPWLQHHWNNSGQQFEAGKLGMWLFLATEFLLFAGLFCAYAVYRSNHPELFEYGAKFLDWKLGATNTAVLIASSFTMAWAVTAAQRGQVKLMNGLLFITFFGGVGFLGIKYMEYTSKFKDNIYWGTALYEEVEGVTHDLTMTNAVIADDNVMVETRFDLPAPQPENLSAVAEAPAGPGGLSASGLALLDAEQTEAHDDDHHHDHGDDHDDHEAHAHGDHGGHDDHAHHPNPRVDPERPANAHLYFGIYYTMTGLHGAHVIIGM
ncbi:MAG: cytochrome c oxidase subunit 3, partial [Planctomycetota bacterium]|nr:cytochrome c oxidase subunit 3 [Planctomycetota bacterium]